MPKETHHDIIGWAVEAWLSNPPDESLGALDGINWLFTSGNLERGIFDRLIERIRDIGNSLPQGNHLNPWSRLYDHAIGKREAKWKIYNDSSHISPIRGGYNFHQNSWRY